MNVVAGWQSKSSTILCFYEKQCHVLMPLKIILIMLFGICFMLLSAPAMWSPPCLVLLLQALVPSLAVSFHRLSEHQQIQEDQGNEQGTLPFKSRMDKLFKYSKGCHMEVGTHLFSIASEIK